MNELYEHLNFVDTDSPLDTLDLNGDLHKDWIQIFYIARCLFSEDTGFPIKSRLAPLLERKEIFREESVDEKVKENGPPRKSNMGEDTDFGRITSMSQISHILPREFLVYSENVFYKKLTNRELLRREYKEPVALSVSELVYGKEKGLNKKQKVYILFDNSSSMSGERYNKLFAAKSICLEYLRRVQKEGPQIYFRTFNQDTGQLERIDKPEKIKGLIKHIITLGTFDCFETRIGNAIIQAIKDIRSDPECRQAEIIMITDGIGDVPEDIKDQLGNIKFHMILISGLEIEDILKLYPDKEALERAANLDRKMATTPLDLDTYLKVKQIFHLREICDLFIRIPSLLGERFKFVNEHELQLIKEIRQTFAKRVKERLTLNEKLELYKKIICLKRYLKILLDRASKDIKEMVKEELDTFASLEKEIMQDEWFSENLENRLSALERNGKGGRRLVLNATSGARGGIVLGCLRILFRLPVLIIKNIPKTMHYMAGSFRERYRRHVLRKRFKEIDKRFKNLLNKG